MNIDGASHCLTSYKLGGSGFISPMSSLGFLNDLILPGAPRSEVDSACKGNEFQRYSLGVKAAGA